MSTKEEFDAIAPEALAKLPKWAREEIITLQRRLEQSNEIIEGLRGQTETGYSAVQAYRIGQATEIFQNISAPYGIDVKPVGSKYPSASLNVQENNGQLEIRATGTPSQLVTFQPASNVIRIALSRNPYELGD